VLDLAILGLLKEKPMHGYELKKRLSYMLGHFWVVSYGSLYPALKRLEKSGAIERAYSVKEKTRHRNVYRITGDGEGKFMRMLTDNLSDARLAEGEKFDVRMAFFQYLAPESRLSLLEIRRESLEAQVATVKTYYSSNRDKEHYRTNMMRHKIDLLKSDIRWLGKLIEHERGMILKRDAASSLDEIEMDTTQSEISVASSV